MSLLELFSHKLLSLGLQLGLNFCSDLLPFDHLGDLIIVLMIEDLQLLFELLLLSVLLGDPHLRHLQLSLDLLDLGHLVQLQ
jgi:hypothetical protein